MFEAIPLRQAAADVIGTDPPPAHARVDLPQRKPRFGLALPPSFRARSGDCEDWGRRLPFCRPLAPGPRLCPQNFAAGDLFRSPRKRQRQVEGGVHRPSQCIGPSFVAEWLRPFAVDAYHLLLPCDDPGLDDGLERLSFCSSLQTNSIFTEKHS